ncbi:MAG: ABC transporter ATP-binding protein [Alphaproteobacteria bacterium]|nr:ABC transporter ATP-binding protein [Alphaproteobacteria bacterium]
MREPVLSVRGLTTEFRVRGAWHAAVRDVSFDLARGETLAIVGESGCGKSITALSVMRLVPSGAGRIAAGSILLEGRDLVPLAEPEMEKVRGDRVSMIFQEPMTSLNPVLSVGFQVAETLHHHRSMGRAEARRAALALFEQVKIPSAARRFDDYPHQFSGGMRQRVMIAMALACNPAVLLADEPTTALDVTIQAQVLALLADVRAAFGMAMVFITHNLGVVASIADRVMVMYAGEVVETAGIDTIFDRPTHPYTEALLRSIPRVDRNTAELQAIGGQVPPITGMPPGCRFADRCALVEARCRVASPPLVPLAGDMGHQVRCWVRAGGREGVP